jgi:hypothetical protein
MPVARVVGLLQTSGRRNIFPRTSCVTCSVIKNHKSVAFQQRSHFRLHAVCPHLMATLCYTHTRTNRYTLNNVWLNMHAKYAAVITFWQNTRVQANLCTRIIACIHTYIKKDIKGEGKKNCIFLRRDFSRDISIYMYIYVCVCV